MTLGLEFPVGISETNMEFSGGGPYLTDNKTGVVKEYKLCDVNYRKLRQGTF